MKELQFYINDTELKHSPDGWDTASIDFERSVKFLGVVRAFSLDLKFVLDGAEILRSQFYSKCPADTFLTINRLDPITLLYKHVFTGKFDFSTFVDSFYSVTCSLVDMSLSSLIKKNLDISYNISFTAYNKMHDPFEGELTRNDGHEYMKFTDILPLFFDRITEGGDFGLDLAELERLQDDVEHPGTEESHTTVITNSMALAGYKFDRLEMKFSDLLKTVFVLYNLVPVIYQDRFKGNMETLRFTDISNTFPGPVFKTVSNVSNLKISIAKDFIYDTIKVGHPEQDYDNDIDASFEIGTTTIFSNKSAILGSQEMDLQTVFRTDSIGIKSYLDLYNDYAELDNEEYIPFLVSTKLWTFPYKRVFDMNNVVIPIPLADAGILSSFNVPISPKRLYKLHEKYINSCLFGTGTETDTVSCLLNMKYLTTVNNNYDPVQEENEGEGITRTQSPLFVPVYIDFDALLPDGLVLSDLYDSTNSRFQFEYNGNTFSGFLMKMKASLYSAKKSSFTLLCSPDNDLSKLIR